MKKTNDSKLAVDLIRQKLSAIYGEEPDAKEELQEAKANPHRSKHQQFMYKLSQSGKSLSEIQTAWHDYYVNLPDNDKHDVWNEFYRQHEVQRKPQVTRQASGRPVAIPARRQHKQGKRNYHQHIDKVHSVKNKVVKTVRTQASKNKTKENLRSLGFGLMMGFITMLIFLFGFFNERFIAPFITPSSNIANVPVITDPNAPVGKEPLLFIPKINLQVPVVYDEKSVAEDAVQDALEDGVLHYATTPEPGQYGNGVIFGHSSNNIFNSGKYKFAFVLLNKLENGDTFSLQKDGKRYVYKVFDKKVVSPSDLSVLDPQGKSATMTLITCDPPGTSLNRLVVVAEQISPSPNDNTKSTAVEDTQTPTVLPSNAPSLWSRFVDWLTG